MRPIKSLNQILDLAINFVLLDIIKIENDLNIIVDAAKIYQNDSLYIDNFNVLSVTENDSALTSVKWKNKGGVSRNEARLTLSTAFNGYNYISNKFIDSVI